MFLVGFIFVRWYFSLYLPVNTIKTYPFMTVTTRIDLAKISLWGLSVGDALGETYFGPTEVISARISNGELQEGNWFFTDDTACLMVCC
jgi:hypothetical protein